MNLTIPEQAYVAAANAYDSFVDGEEIDAINEVLEQAAPWVVAAELRRLADMVPHIGTRTLLLNRADELDHAGGAP